MAGGVFDFVVIGVPRTPQTKSRKSREDWKQKVAQAARHRWPAGQVPFSADAKVTIIYFYEHTTSIDVDAIAKYILDGLEGVAYDDDRIVSDLTLRKTNQLADMSVANPPTVLADALGRYAQFVYVRVTGAPDHRELPE
jgi:Holliday junction resolvase RusA-like endonuclease